jgi:hypothetical protein
MTQLTLDHKFNGPDYVPDRDNTRLTYQQSRIIDCMKDGVWRTLGEISSSVGAPEASVSAQLRHLRKPRFGSHTVNKRYIGQGLFEYQLEVNDEQGPLN